ncbi:MAG: hypothetical protein ACRD4Q_07095 [Candidatus Acidiferrales bacterium]
MALAEERRHLKRLAKAHLVVECAYRASQSLLHAGTTLAEITREAAVDGGLNRGSCQSGARSESLSSRQGHGEMFTTQRHPARVFCAQAVDPARREEDANGTHRADGTFKCVQEQPKIM